MCVVSMVHDHYWPLVPRELPWNPQPAHPFPAPGKNFEKQIADLEKVFKDYRDAVEAAKKVDELTGQPDCVDPEKAKLEERVTKLEIELAALKNGMKKNKKQKKPSKKLPKKCWSCGKRRIIVESDMCHHCLFHGAE